MGNTRYVVEPNIKDGKGGLRDLNTLFWIGKYFYQVKTGAELVDKGVLSAEEYRLFQRAEDFLWAVRCNLHFLTGRADEKLTFDVQPELADRLGLCRPRRHARASSGCMKRYFLVAKDVGDLTRIFCTIARIQPRQGRRHRWGACWRRSGAASAKIQRRDRFRHRFRPAQHRPPGCVHAKDPINLIKCFLHRRRSRICCSTPTPSRRSAARCA